MTVTSDYTSIPSNVLLDLSNTPPVRFRADKMGLSLADVFEAGKFNAMQARLNVGTTLRVQATDGRCWAEVTGITEGGRLVIEPDTGALAEAKRAYTRRAA